MSIAIRPLRLDEVDALGAILVSAFSEYRPSDPNEAEARAWAGYFADIADVRSRFGTTEQIAAELDGALVGGVTYVGPGAFQLEAGRARHTPPGSWATMRRLGVHPSARGHGIGRALTETAIERARAQGASHLALHTNELMVVAAAMYERLGFVRLPDWDYWPIEGSDFTVLAYLLEL